MKVRQVQLLFLVTMYKVCHARGGRVGCQDHMTLNFFWSFNTFLCDRGRVVSEKCRFLRDILYERFLSKNFILTVLGMAKPKQLVIVALILTFGDCYHCRNSKSDSILRVSTSCYVKTDSCFSIFLIRSRFRYMFYC